MTYLKKISIEQEIDWYLCRGESRLLNSGLADNSLLYKKQKFARLYREGDKILKVCLVQSWPKDAIRKYTGKSQAERESASAVLLADLGINTPRTFFSAFSISPWSCIESLHEMSFLERYEFLSNHISERDDSEKIIRLIAKDSAKMINNMIFLKDFGLGNVMYHPNGHISWIDNDLKKFSKSSALTAFAINLLRERVFNYTDETDTKAFWKILSEHCHIHNELLHEFLSYPAASRSLAG